jgi:ATP-dependent Lhr-like helicase
LISGINGVPAREHFLARFLEESGFVPTALGFQMRRVLVPAGDVAEADPPEMDDDDA